MPNALKSHFHRVEIIPKRRIQKRQIETFLLLETNGDWSLYFSLTILRTLLVFLLLAVCLTRNKYVPCAIVVPQLKEISLCVACFTLFCYIDAVRRYSFFAFSQRLLLLIREELLVQTLIEVKQNHRVKELRKQIGKLKLMGPTCDG
jgi:hypothetical protein